MVPPQDGQLSALTAGAGAAAADVTLWGDSLAISAAISRPSPALGRRQSARRELGERDVAAVVEARQALLALEAGAAAGGGTEVDAEDGPARLRGERQLAFRGDAGRVRRHRQRR